MPLLEEADLGRRPVRSKFLRGQAYRDLVRDLRPAGAWAIAALVLLVAAAGALRAPRP